MAQNISLLIPSTVASDRSVSIKDFVEDGQSQIMGSVREIVARKKNGVTFPADLAISKVEHLGLFTVILRDISYRKKLQSHIGGEAWILTNQDLEKLKQTAARLLQGLKEANQHVHTLSHGIMPVALTIY